MFFLLIMQTFWKENFNHLEMLGSKLHIKSCQDSSLHALLLAISAHVIYPKWM